MRKKVLIVDDSQFMRNILSDVLDPTYTVSEAGDGKEAIEQLKKQKPELVLLDIIMPEGEEEGILVLKKIMADRPETKVIMISAVGQDTIINECLALGARNFITKPFDEGKVLATVQACFADGQ
jgi:two-component system chemotaxis response regulator CheY